MVGFILYIVIGCCCAAGAPRWQSAVARLALWPAWLYMTSLKSIRVMRVRAHVSKLYQEIYGSND